MFAKDIMTTNVITVAPEASIAEIAKLLIDKRISATPVVGDDGNIVGIVSEGDLVHRVKGDHELPRSWWLSLIGDPKDVPSEYIKLHGRTAADVMTENVVTVSSFAGIGEIAELLESRRIKRVPVVENGKLVGIVSRANIIQALVGQKDKDVPETATSDREIRELIIDECHDHAWATRLSLNVIVDEGVVRYWGFVDSQDTRDALRIAAENIPGVKAVETNLSISSAPPDYL